MDKRTEQSIRNYNNIAAGYDESFEGRYTSSFISELTGCVSLADGNRVLDVACGNGSLLKRLSGKAAIEAYGIDVSENMVHEARKRHREFDFNVSDSSSLPFADGFFDVITVSAAFHHFSRPDAFISEARRVLRKGGRIYIADPYFPPFIRQLANLIIPLYGKGDVKVYNKAQLKGFLDRRGFKNIQVRRFDKKGYVMTGDKE